MKYLFEGIAQKKALAQISKDFKQLEGSELVLEVGKDVSNGDWSVLENMEKDTKARLTKVIYRGKNTKPKYKSGEHIDLYFNSKLLGEESFYRLDLYGMSLGYNETDGGKKVYVFGHAIDPFLNNLASIKITLK